MAKAVSFTSLQSEIIRVMSSSTFSQLTIGQRVSLGFALLLLMGAGLGGVAAWQMHQAAGGAHFLAVAVAPQADVSSRLAKASLAAQREVVRYSLSGGEKALTDAKRLLGDVDAALAEAVALSRDQPSLTALAKAETEAKQALRGYLEQVTATEVNLAKLSQIRTTLDESAAAFLKQLNAFIRDQEKKLKREISADLSPEALQSREDKLVAANRILEICSTIRVLNFKGQAMNDVATLSGLLTEFDNMETLRAELQAACVDVDNIKQMQLIGEAAQTYRGGIAAIIENFSEAQRIAQARAAAVAEFDVITANLMERSIARTLDYANDSSSRLSFSSQAILWGLSAMVLAGIVGALVIIRSVNRALTDTADQLSQGSMQVAAASGQVSAASQSLAEGSSEQAASLEEISSSIEELSSMTKRNAGNAQTGKTSAAQAREAAEAGAKHMAQMQQAMAAIQESSSGISKIIKTIDEIAFQTNILALNAAVEAARAGEAGAGFAVVADEVRNLAQRSAVAARETADKIEDAVARSAQGVDISAQVATGLEQIVTKVREVDRLVAEVAVASQEQSEGLVQINSAITQMDKVTQSSAASAEETASAAEELNAQSEELRLASETLARMVGITSVSARSMPAATRAKTGTKAPAPAVASVAVSVPTGPAFPVKASPVADDTVAELSFRD